MIDNLSPHHRRSIRLHGYDYSTEGGYFITIVTHERQQLFGEIVDGAMNLNEYGIIARDEWFRTAQIRSYVELFEDDFIVMPNHVHGIIWITNLVGAYCNTPLPKNTRLPANSFHSPGIGIGAIVRGYKSTVTKRINLLRDTRASPLWQRNYYEHIIGADREYEAIAEYIYSNPSNWKMDKENI